jgi:hypothetical protein
VVHIGRSGTSRGPAELKGRDSAGSSECAPSTSGDIHWKAEQRSAWLSTGVRLPGPAQTGVGTEVGVGMPPTVILRTLVGSPVACPRRVRPDDAKRQDGKPSRSASMSSCIPAVRTTTDM